MLKNIQEYNLFAKMKSIGSGHEFAPMLSMHFNASLTWANVKQILQYYWNATLKLIKSDWLLQIMWVVLTDFSTLFHHSVAMLL